MNAKLNPDTRAALHAVMQHVNEELKESGDKDWINTLKDPKMRKSFNELWDALKKDANLRDR